ncbi:MAG: hypothetical protein M3Q33_13685 [Acidobacteriota bacterium]|nr:hypothetical protein [Acidobacteriota bacterium]
MKTNLTLVLILILACGSILQAKGQTTQQFKLQVNEQKTITKDKLKIRFISVIEDSRCPEGTNCVWAGNAKVHLKLKKRNGAWEIFELNTNLEKKEIRFGGYAIKIVELTPTPKSNVRINRNGYVATFSITKS